MVMLLEPMPFLDYRPLLISYKMPIVFMELGHIGWMEIQEMLFLSAQKIMEEI